MITRCAASSLARAAASRKSAFGFSFSKFSTRHGHQSVSNSFSEIPSACDLALLRRSCQLPALSRLVSHAAKSSRHLARPKSIQTPTATDYADVTDECRGSTRDLPTSVSREDLRSKITNLVEQFRLVPASGTDKFTAISGICASLDLRASGLCRKNPSLKTQFLDRILVRRIEC